MGKQGKYGFDHVPVDESRERVKPIYDGLAVGTIKSVLSETKISGEDYCRVFGHHPKKYGDGVFCRDCGIPVPKPEEVREQSV